VGSKVKVRSGVVSVRRVGHSAQGSEPEGGVSSVVSNWVLRLVGRSVRRARGGVILKSTTTKGGLL
jgi:hypothetical protein